MKKYRLDLPHLLFIVDVVGPRLYVRGGSRKRDSQNSHPPPLIEMERGMISLGQY